MKIDSMPGEFFYRALVRDRDGSNGYLLTVKYYSTREELIADYPGRRVIDVQWPVDEIDRGVLYIPSEGELQ